MEGQDYLNQISAKVRPTQQTKWDKLKSSKIFWVVTIGIVAFFAILIIGGMLGGNKNSGKNIAFSLKLRIDNVSGIINDYQPRVKSSELRSSSASLYSVLSNTNRDLTESITTLYGYEEGNTGQALIL